MPMTPAEKQQAYRDRQRREAEDREAEDRYVAECMKLPPLVAAQPPPSQPQTNYEERYAAARQRQEAYARWRWSAWRHGEVSGL